MLPQTEQALRLFVADCAAMPTRIATGQVDTRTPTYALINAQLNLRLARKALRKLLRRKYPQMPVEEIDRQVVMAAAQK